MTLCPVQSIDFRGQLLSYPPSGFDPGGALCDDELLYPRKQGHSLWSLFCVPPSPSLPLGNIHTPSEGWAFRSLTHPTALNHRLARFYDDVQVPRNEIPPDTLFLLFTDLTLADKPPLLHVEMDSDPLSLLNVFVTVTSLLPNGKSEVLEVHIFNRERTGILVGFFANCWFR